MEKPNKNYLHRVQEAQIKNLLDVFPAILIEGAKGTGKSTLGEYFAKSSLFMQNPDYSKKYLDMAQLKPSLLLKGEKPRLIDEWQMAPVLWDAIRFESDKTKGESGQFILTGSSVPLDNSTMHTGTGRFAHINVRPMSLYESGESTGEISLQNLFISQAEDIVGKSEISLEDIASILVRGGWPLAVINKAKGNNSAYVNEYVESIIQQDASRLDGIEKNPIKLYHFMRALARATATDTALSRIKADMKNNQEDISENTLYSYQNALKRLFVIEDLPAWSMKLRSKTTIRTTDVRHFADPSIASALLGAGSGDLLNDPETFGLLFESLCIRDLRIYADTFNAKVSHYRDKNGLEADAILHLQNGKWAAIEIKLGASWIEEAAKNLLKLKSISVNEPEFLMVIIPEGFAYKREDGIFVCPISCLKP